MKIHGAALLLLTLVLPVRSQVPLLGFGGDGFGEIAMQEAFQVREGLGTQGDLTGDGGLTDGDLAAPAPGFVSVPAAHEFVPGRDTFPVENFGCEQSPSGVCWAISRIEQEHAMGGGPALQGILAGAPLGEAGGDPGTLGALKSLAGDYQEAGRDLVAPSWEAPLGRMVQTADGHWQIRHDEPQWVGVPGQQEDYPLGTPAFTPQGNLEISYDQGLDETAGTILERIERDGPVLLRIDGQDEGKSVGHALLAYGAAVGMAPDPLDGRLVEGVVRYQVSDSNRDAHTLYYWPNRHRFSVGDGDWTQGIFHQDRGTFLDPQGLAAYQ